MSAIAWDITLAELTGGMEQLLHPEAYDRCESVYPTALRRGCSRLAAAMLSTGASPPVSLPDTIELLNPACRSLAGNACSARAPASDHPDGRRRHQ